MTKPKTFEVGAKVVARLPTGYIIGKIVRDRGYWTKNLVVVDITGVESEISVRDVLAYTPETCRLAENNPAECSTSPSTAPSPTPKKRPASRRK